MNRRAWSATLGGGPSVWRRVVEKFLDFADTCGLKRDALLHKAGLQFEDDPELDGRVSQEVVYGLIETVAAHVGDLPLGLEFAQVADTWNSHVVGFLMRTSPPTGPRSKASYVFNASSLTGTASTSCAEKTRFTFGSILMDGGDRPIVTFVSSCSIRSR